MRYVTGVSPELGLEPPYIALFVLTFAVSIVNLMRGRVNMMQGVVHLLIFATWIMVIFDESWALNV
jgi:Ca2+:H+ antiporter